METYSINDTEQLKKLARYEGKLKKLGYYGERYIEAMEDAADIKDTQYLTPSTLAFVKKDPVTGEPKGFHKIIGGEKTYEMNKDELGNKKPVLGKAVVNFENFLSGICGEEKKKELEYVFEGLDFEQAFAMVNDQIQIIYEISTSFKKKIFFLKRGIEDLTTNASDVYSSSLNYVLSDFVNFETVEKKDFEETLEKVEDIHIRALRAVGASEEKKEEINKYFEYLKLLFSERKDSKDKEKQLEEIMLILNDLLWYFQDIFFELLREFSEMNEKDFEDLAWATFSIQSDFQELAKSFQVDFSKYEEEFSEIRKSCTERDPIYCNNLQDRAEDKALILSGLNRLFQIASSAEELKKIGELINKIEPNNDNNRPMKIRTVPETFFSEAEIRALRLYFAHVQLSISNAKESFLMRELEELIFVQKEVEKFATALEIKTNRLIMRLEKSDLSDEVKEYLFRKIMDTEYGLVVRDKETGLSISTFETERYKEGDRWFYMQSERRILPNYEPILRPHSQNAETFFGANKREFQISDQELLKRYRDFEKFVNNSPAEREDLENALMDEQQIEEIILSERNIEELTSEIFSLIKASEEHGVDVRQEALELFLEISRTLKKTNEKKRGIIGAKLKISDLAFGKKIFKACLIDYFLGFSEENRIKVVDAMKSLILSFQKLKESLSLMAGIFNDEKMGAQYKKIGNHIDLITSKLRGFKKDFSAFAKKLKKKTAVVEDLYSINHKLRALEYDYNFISNLITVYFEQAEIQEISRDQTERLFDAIDSLLGLGGIFSETDVRALSLMFLSQKIPFDLYPNSDIYSDKIWKDFQYDLFFSAMEAKTRHEELLSSLLPQLFKMKEYIAQNDSIDEDRKALITEQLELAEWGLSGRVLATKKPTFEDKFLMSIRNGIERKIQERAEIEETIDIAEEEDLQEAYELQESDEEILKKAGVFNIDKLLFRYAIPSAVATMIASLVTLAIKDNDKEGADLSQENVLMASVENPGLVEMEKSEIERKYETGELIYGSENENDKFGFELLTIIGEGIGSKEEAEKYFNSLDSKARKEINQVLKASISLEEISQMKKNI
ncbi:MAG: hypothetical protein RBS56_01200 [Candidatus Gracilibacteria bacterium]|jgi:hypothetical protein|nr:hypothetical protein [Candidatus Gracilibacteria bacterium]